MANYAEIEDVRRRGFDESSPTDNEIEAAIAIASDLINTWCGQDFDYHEDDTIVLDGNGGDRIIAGKRIIEITELKVNKNSIPSVSIVFQSNNTIGEIALIDGFRFFRGVANVLITADTGWAEVPLSVTEACAHMASMILNRQMFEGRPFIAEMESEKLLDYTRKRMKPSDIRGIIESDTYLFGLLRPYRLKGVAI